MLLSSFRVFFETVSFSDMLLLLVLPLAGAIFLSWRTFHSGKSAVIQLFLWLGFFAITVTGLGVMFHVAHNERIAWTTLYSELARSYARTAKSLGHWRIQSGDAATFSSWSKVLTVDRNQKSEIQSEESFVSFSVQPLSRTRFRVSWSPVSDSTTYRLQWNQNRNAIRQYVEEHTSSAYQPTTPEANAVSNKGNFYDTAEGWETIFSGAATTFEMTLSEKDWPSHPLLLRVRAETGTPEDEPDYQPIFCLFRDEIRDNSHSNSVYTLRKIDDDNTMFIVETESYPGEKNILTAYERHPAIGEPYMMTPDFKKVFDTGKSTINIEGIKDEWGEWIVAVEPLHDPDGNLEAILCVDFVKDNLANSIRQAKMVPRQIILWSQAIFLVGMGLVSRLKRYSNRLKNFTETLQATVDNLAKARQAAEEDVVTKSRFLANMSHEIRTPLNAILGFTGILGERLLRLCDADEYQDNMGFLKMIEKSGADLLTIIGDILDYSKVEAGQVDIEQIPVSPEQILEDVRSMLSPKFQDKPEVELQISIDNNVPAWILGDPTRLRQILTNLAGNSLKFTEKGYVRIHCQAERIKEEEDGVMIHFKVMDTGIGISSEKIKKLFQPFIQAEAETTRKFGGTGLGLSIAKRFVQLFDGDIVVTSEKGKGSTFDVVFPATISTTAGTGSFRATFAVDADLQESGAKSLEGIYVLLVEDGKINQVVISTQLREAGAKIEVADDGRVALDLIAAKELLGSHFDAVLMDMQMPVMDGYTATKRLRSKGFMRPIIAITANALSGDCEKTIDAGCNAYISKPIAPKLLISTILQLLRNAKHVSASVKK